MSDAFIARNTSRFLPQFNSYIRLVKIDCIVDKECTAMQRLPDRTSR